MKIRNLLSCGLAAAALLLPTACAEEYASTSFGEKVPLRLTAGTAPVTRAATNLQSTTFDAGETLNAYVTAKKTGEADIIVGAPALCTTGAPSGGINELTASPKLYFPYDTDYKLDIFALYPSTVTQGATSFGVKEDQKADNAYKQSDLMWAGDHANDKPLTPIAQADGTTTKTVNLPFRHKMAKLIVKAEAIPGSGEGVGTINSIKLKSVSRSIGFAPTTGVLGSDNSLADVGDIELGNTGLGIDVDGDDVGDGNACVFPPQTVRGDFLEIATTNGKANFALVGSKKFEEGEVYTVTIYLSASNLGQTAAIADWPDTGDKRCNLVVNALGAGSLQIAEIPDIDPEIHGTYDRAYFESNNKYRPSSLTVKLNGTELNATDYIAEYYNNDAAGKYGVVVVTGKGSYADAGTSAQTFLIKNGTIVYDPEPVAVTHLTYNGTAQSLLANSPKAYKGSTHSDAYEVPIKYCTTQTGYYSTTPPTGTNAGTYEFWYKVDDKDGYSGIAPRQKANIIIDKADLDLDNVTITRPTAITGLKYNEKLQQLVTAASCTDAYGNSIPVSYCIGTSATTAPATGYTAEVPMRSDAGTYYVWWQVGGDNYNGTTPQCIPVTIDKGPGRINFSPTSLNYLVTDRKGTKNVVHIDHAGTGTVTVSCDDPNISVVLSNDGKKMTITRVKENENATANVVVRVAESDNCYEKTETFTVTLSKCKLHLEEVKSTDQRYLGYVVSTTGYIYPNTDEGLSMLSEEGGTPAGIIFYLASNISGMNGYVLALNDANNGNAVQFKNAESVVSSYVPKIKKQNGTDEYTWKFGSHEDFQYVCSSMDLLFDSNNILTPLTGTYWTSYRLEIFHDSRNWYLHYVLENYVIRPLEQIPSWGGISEDFYYYKVRPIFVF